MLNIQLTIAINFFSSKDNDEEFVMHSKSDYLEMINDKPEEVIEELFQSLLSRYLIGFETSMRGSDSFFSFIVLCHKINFE